MNAFGIDTNTTAVPTNEVRTLSGMMTVQDAIKRADEMTVASGVVLLVDEFVYRHQDPRESVAKVLA